MNEVDVGGILSRTFRIVGDSARASALFTIVFGALGAAAELFGLVDSSEFAFGIGGGFVVDENTTAIQVVFELGLLAASLVGFYLLMREQLRSQGKLGTGGGSFWFFLGMSILALLGVMLGFFLLIVPGIIIMVRWAAANGFVISKGLGPVEALKASWKATDGHSWSIFLAGLVLTIGIGVVAGIIVVPLAAVSLTVAGVVAPFLDAFGNVLTFGFSVAVYCLVHNDEEEMAEVFR